jgi:peroxiredoxin
MSSADRSSQPDVQASDDFGATNETAPKWMRYVLLAAAAYNLIWGAWVVLRPDDLFDWVGIMPPRYPGIWQCVGMIVGVYGVGYAIAAFDPFRHWPIVLVGFLGKVFGPIGMIYNLLLATPGDGQLPVQFAWTNLTNDVIWWIPFAVILYLAFKAAVAPVRKAQLDVAEANRRFRSQHGMSIAELSTDTPVMLLFLRHRGCTFCREALADLSGQLEQLRAANVTPAIVFMGQHETAAEFFDSYGLGNVHRISDPECELYRAYDLGRGKLHQLFGLSVWWSGFKAAVIDRHGVGKLEGDGFQMPGVFVIRQNQIIKKFRHKTAASRPRYAELACEIS